MSTNRTQLGLLVAGTVLLAGCASAGASPARLRSLAPNASMTPGMVMPDGSTMGAAPPAVPATPTAATSPVVAAAAQPSASAMMLCSNELRSTIAKVLALQAIPAGTPTWGNDLYTCTYRLPIGALTLSVKQTASTAATDIYFAAQQKQLGTTKALEGLGQGAYGTDTGTVVLRKDNDVLRVDATALPAQFGSQQEKRNDFAYEIASDILGCWTGG